MASGPSERGDMFHWFSLFLSVPCNIFPLREVDEKSFFTKDTFLRGFQKQLTSRGCLKCSRPLLFLFNGKALKEVTSVDQFHHHQRSKKYLEVTDQLLLETPRQLKLNFGSSSLNFACYLLLPLDLRNHQPENVAQNDPQHRQGRQGHATIRCWELHETENFGSLHETWWIYRQSDTRWAQKPRSL